VTGSDLLPLIAQAATNDQSVTTAVGVLQSVLEYVGIIAFAISGALVAGRKRMDVAGVVMLGSIVAVGGGTIRDVLVGSLPVFWVENPTFMIVGALTALAIFPLARTGTLAVMQHFRLVQLTDAAGTALFVVTGVNVALSAGADNLAAIIVGVISGIGGGIIRDILADEVPKVFVRSHYRATGAFVGAALYVFLLETSVSRVLSAALAVALIFGIRAFAILYKWRVPIVAITDDTDRK
jgi:uncharacterized membrane protein YeiH